jgi:hypothetical protein
MITAFDRRRFLNLLVGATSGLGLQFTTGRNWTTAAKNNTLIGDVPSALGKDRFASLAELILDQFATANSGQLMAYYQTFWPFALNTDVILALKEASARNIDSPRYAPKRHRVRVIPAVAGIHALGHLKAEDRNVADQLIVSTHDTALNVEPHRQMLEIIWQNVVTAIIRNEKNWANLILPQQLIEQGAELCRRFLRGENTLFVPALVSFQALTTYEKALLSRGDPESIAEVESLLLDLCEFESGTESRWLRGFRALMENRNHFTTVPPQLSEIFMGHGKFDPAISDYIAIARLYGEYLLNRILEGEESAYESPETAQEAVKTARTFLGDYGFTPDEWARLQRAADQFLPHRALSYLRGLFAEYDKHVEELMAERGEGTDVERLTALIPFRNYDEQTVAKAAFPSEGSDSLESRALQFGPGLMGLLSASEPGIRRVTRTYTQRLHIGELHDNIVADVPPALLEQPLRQYEETLDYLKSLRRTMGAPIRSRDSGAFVAPPRRDRAMDDRAAVYRKERERAATEEAAGRLVFSEDELTSDQHNTLDEMLKDIDFNSWRLVSGRR